MSITLPTTKIASSTQDPKNLIIFSQPKTGKSTACANLPDALCIDLESGYDYIDACKVKANSVKEIREICKAIIDAGKPYKFIVIDTISRLEEMVKPLALQMYLETPAGSKFTGTDVTLAPMGAGYSCLRNALEKVIGWISQCADNIILICHTKDAAIANTDLTTKSIDLAGKTGRILASKSDAIGYMYRNENSETVLSFDTNNQLIETGARPAHLRNKEIVLGALDAAGEFEFYWDRIYPSLKS